MNSILQIHRNHLLIFLLFVGFLILHFIFGYIGHYGFDDMEYASISSQLARGNFPVENHFAYRFALIIPTTASYLLFGINDLSSSIPPLLASTLILYFILLFFKKESVDSLVIALSLCTLSPWFLRYSYMIMPDIYVCLAFVAAVYFLWKSQNEKKHVKRKALAFSLSLFFGFLSKGTIVLILPLILLIFTINLFKRKKLQFWIWASIYGFSLLLVYSALIYFISGDALMRFKVIGENAYLNRCSYAAQGSSILLKRISIDFLNLMQRDHILIPFLLLVPSLLFAFLKNKIALEKKTHFLSLSALTLLLSSNFMSISLTAYHPMCLDIRHYLFLIPLSSIPLALTLANKQEIQKTRWLLIAILMIGLIISYQYKNAEILIHCLLVSITVLLYMLFYAKKGAIKWFSIILPLALLIKPIDMMRAASELNYEGRRDFVKKELIEDGEAKIILTDPVQANLGNYYLGFDSTKMRFEDFRNFNLTKINANINTYYLDNYHSAQQSFISNSDIPFFLKRASSAKPIVENKNLAVRIYEVIHFDNVQSEEHLIYRLENNFDAEIDPWTQSSDYLRKDPINKQNQVSLVGEYSSTFHLQFDSLEKKNNNLFISAKCTIFSMASTKAKLVMSIENTEGSIIYESQEIDPLIKSYSNWWEVKLESALKWDMIPKGSSLKVYLWNIEKEELYLDNLEVKIYSY